ncbi:MAG: hypothetical protein Q8868_13990 [Bacteroidota bacterium]|nr:hypothetical protein [Bacteroidota bacterium]
MYQRDYILRMIEMIGDLIAGIMGLIRKGELKKASKELSDVYRQMLREDSSFFSAIPAEELTDTLLQQHNYTNGHLEILAELFNAEAELKLAQGNKTGSLEYSLKSLMLFEFIGREQKTFSFEREEKIDGIRKRIENLQGE